MVVVTVLPFAGGRPTAKFKPEVFVTMDVLGVSHILSAGWNRKQQSTY